MRRTVVIILSIAILCSLFIVVFAVTNSNTEDGTTSLAGNSFEYARVPDGLDVFIYHGYSPYSSPNLDTSECVLDRLYVYNSVENSLVTISEQAVAAYTYTQTALYYVTTEQKIYKTDYSGINHEHLYQCTQGDIDNLRSYFDTLYFIEDRSSVILLDVVSKTAQEIWTYENLSWAIMLNDDQLIATTTEEDDYLYDIPTNTATLISEIESTNLITAAVKGTSSNNARSTTAPNFAAMVTQENNVSFPVPGYDVVNYNSYPTFVRPESWFHKNGQEGCGDYDENCDRYSGSGECMGFAKYVHDVYAHMGDDTYVDSNNNGIADGSENYLANKAWEDRTCMTYHRPPAEAFEDGTLPSSIDKKLTPREFEDIDDITSFFGALNTGAYVRYGKYYDDGDTSPEDGCHSIVFIANDEDGIWVYECNQSYYNSLTPAEKAAHPKKYYGCGVFIQYYPYWELDKYRFVLNYVNHEYSDTWGYLDADYHSKNCTKCIGHVKKEHTSVSATIASATQHNATFNCCGGNTATTLHTGTTSKSYYSKASHKVTATCCSGYVLANHTFQMDFSNRSVCTGCGYVKGALIVAGI